MQNEWIVSNHGRVFRTLEKLERFKMKGAFTDDLDLDEIQQIISQSYKEVSNLQGKLTILNERYETLKQNHEDTLKKIQEQAPEQKPSKKKK